MQVVDATALQRLLQDMSTTANKQRCAMMRLLLLTHCISAINQQSKLLAVHIHMLQTFQTQHLRL